MYVTRISRYLQRSVLSAVSRNIGRFGTYYPCIRGTLLYMYIYMFIYDSKICKVFIYFVKLLEVALFKNWNNLIPKTNTDRGNGNMQFTA
jgi:hypothetical protein